MIDTTALFGAKAAEPGRSTGEAPASLDGFAALLDEQLGAAAHEPVGPFGIALLDMGPASDAAVAPIRGFSLPRHGDDARPDADDDPVAPPGVPVPVSDVLGLLSGDRRVTAPGGTPGSGHAATPRPSAPAASAASPAGNGIVVPLFPDGVVPLSSDGVVLGGPPSAGETALPQRAEGDAPSAPQVAGAAPAPLRTEAPEPPLSSPSGVPTAPPAAVMAAETTVAAVPASAPTRRDAAPIPAGDITPSPQGPPSGDGATPPDPATAVEPRTGRPRTEQPPAQRPEAVADGPRPAPVVQSVAPAGPAAPGSSPVAHLVDRIAAVVDMLHDQPPPRSFVIEVPQLDGAQIRVALRGDGTVHLGLAGERPAPAAMPVIAAARAALVDRGFDFGPDSRGRRPQTEQDDVVEIFGRGRRTTRPVSPGLRI